MVPRKSVFLVLFFKYFSPQPGFRQHSFLWSSVEMTASPFSSSPICSIFLLFSPRFMIFFVFTPYRFSTQKLLTVKFVLYDRPPVLLFFSCTIFHPFTGQGPNGVRCIWFQFFFFFPPRLLAFCLMFSLWRELFVQGLKAANFFSVCST